MIFAPQKYGIPLAIYYVFNEFEKNWHPSIQTLFCNKLQYTCKKYKSPAKKFCMRFDCFGSQ